MPRRTLKKAEEELQTARKLVGLYRNKYDNLISQKGEHDAQRMNRANVINAVSELATANAKLTYAISRVIEMSTK